jgi:hypothetical protein
VDRDALLVELARCYARAAAQELLREELARREREAQEEARAESCSQTKS